jgi:hypothetical protein
LFRKFYVFILGKGEVQMKEVEGEGCRGEKGEKMIDLVIKGGDLIGDRHHPKEPNTGRLKNWGPTFN